MPNTVKKLSELRAARDEIRTQFETLEAQAQQLLDAGDNLGASKIVSQAEPLLQLFNEAETYIQQEKQALRSKIGDGTILTDDLDQPGAVLPTDMDGIQAKYQDALSQAFEAPVDLSSGLGARIRKNLAFIQPENKAQYLIEKEGFAPENVVTEKVGNSPVTFVKDENGVWTPIDEFGVTGKDFIDAAGEIFPTTGSVVGGIAGFGLTKTPLGATTGSAAGYTTFGALQDQVARTVLGVGDNFINAIPRRATEAAVGMPIEYATMKLGAPVARALGTSKSGTQTKRAKMFAEAEEDLANLGYKTNLARIASGSVEKQNKLVKAGQRLKSWTLGRDLIVGAQRLEKFKDDMIGAGELPDALYRDTIKVFQADRKNLVRQVSIANENLGRQLDSVIRDQIYAVSDPARSLNQVKLGDFVYESVRLAQENAKKAKNQFYDPFYKEADSVVNVDPLELADHLSETFNKRVGRPPEVQKKIDELRQRPANQKKMLRLQKLLRNPNISENVAYKARTEIKRLENLSGNLNASQLDDVYRGIRDAAPTGPVAGSGAGTLKEASASVAAAAKEFRDDVYRKAGIYDEWLAASKSFDDFMTYSKNTNTLPSLLESIGGTQRRKMSGAEMSSLIFKSPENLQEVLTAVQRDTPEQFPVFKARLQDEYLNRIGLNGNKVGSVNKFDFDEDIVIRLFSEGSDRRGKMMISKLRDLQEVVAARNLDPSKITNQDITNLSRTLSEDSVRELQQGIAARIAAEDALESQVSNVLLKDALNGHIESISQGAFPKALFNAEPDVVRKILAKFPAKDQKTLRNDYAEYLFSLYKGEPDATIGRLMLWNGQKLLDDIKVNPRIRKNMEIVLGESDTKGILSASRLVEAVRTTPYREGVEVTGVITQDKNKGITARLFAPFQYVASWFGDRGVAALYRAGELSPILRNLGRKELTPEQYDQVVAKGVRNLLFTSQGIQALLETGKYDPEWSYTLGRTVGALSKESLEFKKKYGFEDKPELSN